MSPTPVLGRDRWAMSHLPMEVDKRGVRTVAGIESGLHMHTSMNSRWSAMVVCKLKVSLLLHP